MDQARNLVSNFDATAGKSQNNANSMDVESVGSGGGSTSTSTSTSNSNSNSTSNTISHNNSQPPQAVKADVAPLITPNVPGIYTNDTSNKKGKLRKGKWTVRDTFSKTSDLLYINNVLHSKLLLISLMIDYKIRLKKKSIRQGLFSILVPDYLPCRTEQP